MKPVYLYILGLIAWNKLYKLIKDIQCLDNEKFNNYYKEADTETKKLLIMIRTGADIC